MLCLVAQSCLTLWDLMDCSLLGSSVNRILQARILEWVAMPSSRGSSTPGNQTQVSRTVGGFLTIWATRNILVIFYLPQILGSFWSFYFLYLSSAQFTIPLITISHKPLVNMGTCYPHLTHLEFCLCILLIFLFYNILKYF